MLAVLTTICFSLRHTMSTQEMSPPWIAATVLAVVSQPMSLAKWLNVPPGKTASGTPCSTAIDAAAATVPSPPPTPSTSASRAAARSTSSTSSSSFSSTILACGRASRTSSSTRAPVPLPEAGLTTSVTPAPSGRSGVSTRSGATSGQPLLDDRRHHLRPQYRDARPETEPCEHVARVVRAGGHPGHPDQTRQQCQAEADRWVLQPDPDRERGGTGRVSRRQRVRRREPAGLPGQRHQEAARPFAAPDPLGDLVGDQAGHPQRDDTACGAALDRRGSEGGQRRGDGEPQLRMVGGLGQPRHHRVQERAGRLRDGLEHLAVQRAEALADLTDSTVATKQRRQVHAANLAARVP